MSEHEYSLLGGFNRARIGRYLTLIAASVSAGVVFVLLTIVDVAKQLGVPANLPPTILSLAGASAVFSALYWVFDRHVWRWPPLARLLKVPDLSGDWNCSGQSLGPDGRPTFSWQGTISIAQSWDKLRVRLRTDQSGSNSITAALVSDELDGYRLLYNYRNEPRIGETQLKAHLGFADLLFNKKATSAEGEYFNGHGRFTFGTMRLTRIEHGK